jgi:hypothetical protein
MAYVYRHIRLDKNEVFYVGIGSDTPYYRRAGERARRSKFWKKIIAKTEWVSEIIFDDISWEEAIIKEIEFIKLYGRKNLGTGTLVNLTDGGEGTVNKVFSEEYRRNLSNSMIGRVVSEEMKQKLRTYRLGKPNSEEARKKISLANKGKKKPQHAIDLLKLRVGDKNPNFGNTGVKSKNFKGYIEAYKNDLLIGTYEGIYRCSEELNVAATKISAVLMGKRNKTGGYTFKRKQ